MGEMIQAAIYGDSIMHGTVMDENGRYRSMIEENLRRFGARFHVEMRNRARYGLTIDQGQRLLQRDLAGDFPCAYALLEFGGNDCDFRWNEVAQRPADDHCPRTCLPRFLQIAAAMLDDLRARGVKPILMTLPPLDAERYLRFIAQRGSDAREILRFLGDAQMIYRFHEYYSNAIARLALQTGTFLVDVRGYFLDKRNFQNLLCQDGVHPNVEGHRLILDAFADFATHLT